MKNVVTDNKVGRNVWASDNETETGGVGVRERSRRHREETERSRTVWSGEERVVFSYAYLYLQPGMKCQFLHWQQTSVKFTATLCVHSSLA